MRFAVHYTDAGDLPWKQHLGGKIERDPLSQALLGPPRKADTVQPYSPQRTMTKEQAAEVLSGRFDSNVPLIEFQQMADEISPLPRSSKPGYGSPALERQKPNRLTANPT